MTVRDQLASIDLGEWVRLQGVAQGRHQLLDRDRNGIAVFAAGLVEVFVRLDRTDVTVSRA